LGIKKEVERWNDTEMKRCAGTLYRKIERGWRKWELSCCVFGESDSLSSEEFQQELLKLNQDAIFERVKR
jgi:hypothetical protein